VAVDELLWDAGNLAHLAERNAARSASGEVVITRAEVDEMYQSAQYEPFGAWYVDRRSGQQEWQVRLVGRTPGGRYLTAGCQIDTDTGRFRPVTVWESSPAEIRAYRRERPDD
jgi:hypothetical protein